ncbi:MAG: N-acyl-D-amino-acid deacylase family protein [Ruminiclostridium sp.]
MYSLIIENCYIIDGSGSLGYKGDIGIIGERIAAIGALKAQDCMQKIDVHGMNVCPGFIDIHSHSDLDILKYPFENNKLKQGITTEVTGNCGLSLFPFSSNSEKYFQQVLSEYNRVIDIDWYTAEQFFSKLEATGFGVNIAPLTGHGTLRINACGFNANEISAEKIEYMKCLLAETMEQGAFGMSSGLGYPPCCFAATTELIELAKVLKTYNGIFTVHLRDQGNELLESVQEVIRVGEETGVAVDISHIKASGKSNWGKVQEALKLIDAARSRGANIICDFYPYTAAENTLIYELPKWLNEGGPEKCIPRLRDSSIRKRIAAELADLGEAYWDTLTVIRVGTKKNMTLKGLTIGEIASNSCKNAIDTVCDLLIEENLAVEVVAKVMCENDVLSVAKYPYAAIGSDSYAQSDKPSDFFGHPRNYGCFPRFIHKYINNQKAVTLEEGIRRMTSFSASFVGIKDRGLLKQGNYADIVIFDAQKIQDRATYKKPSEYSEGIHYVIINGNIQVKKGEVMRIPCGKLLRHNE